MSAPFPTRWHFILATVLIGVNRQNNTFYAVETGSQEQSIAIFSTEEAALDLPASVFDPQVIKVVDLLSMLPDGIGVIVNPGSPGGLAGDSMHVDPSTLSSLKELLPPLPSEVALEFRPWIDMPATLGRAIVEQAQGEPALEEVWALLYTIEDSPHLGLLAYRAKTGDDRRASSAVVRALNGSVTLIELDVASVQVVSYGDLPRDVREQFGDSTCVVGNRERRS